MFLLQVIKMIEEARPSGRTRQPVSQLTLMDWLVENKILSIALEGKLVSLLRSLSIHISLSLSLSLSLSVLLLLPVFLFVFQ